MHLEKVFIIIVFSLCKPEPKFRHQQSYQRAGALSGSFKISQNTDNILNEVEHQKRVNTEKIWKTDYLVSRSNQTVNS